MSSVYLLILCNSTIDTTMLQYEPGKYSYDRFRDYQGMEYNETIQLQYYTLFQVIS